MRRYIAYLWYVLIHKYHVFNGCRIVGLPLWVGIVHDYDKFRPAMFIAYARFFYNPNGTRTTSEQKDANPDIKQEMMRWFRNHYSTQPHHWEYWTRDRANPKTSATKPMTDRYILEMIADWYGAGIAINGKQDVLEWYDRQLNTGNINLHEDTIPKVTNLIAEKFPPEFVNQTRSVI